MRENLIRSGKNMINKIIIDTKRRLRNTSSFYILGSLLAACNSGGSGKSDSGSISTPLIGAVVKGPLQGALVYADNDGDGIGDGDPIMTGTDGSYTVSATNPNATIIAVSGPNTVDTSSGETLTGITLKAPPGSTVVTPATTILEAQPDIEPQQLAIALGIPTTASDGTAIDLTSFNPYSSDADPAAALAVEKASQQVMVTIKAVSAAAEGAGMEVEKAFEQAMASVAEVVSEVAEKIDTSSPIALAEAEASVASGVVEKFDFSDTAVLADISAVVQEKVLEVAAADDEIVLDEAAFASVLDSAMTAVENVNLKIETVEDLTSEESMGVFATLTDVTSEIKLAAEAEVLEPGSGLDLVTFTDPEKVDNAAEIAALEVADNLLEAAEAFEEIYETFLEEYPVEELPKDPALEGNTDLSNPDLLDISDPLDPDISLTDDLVVTNPDELLEDTLPGADEENDPEEEIKDSTIDAAVGGGGGGGSTIIYSEEPADLDYTLLSKSSSGSNILVEFSANLGNMKIDKGFDGLTGFSFDIQPVLGWSGAVDAQTGNVAFDWSNSLSTTNSSGVTNAVISTNSSLSNSSVGKIVFISSEDVSGGSGLLSLGTLTLDPKDGVTDISALVTATFVDSSGDIISQTSTMDLY